MAHSVHMAEGDESVSVRHRVCCGAEFNGRFTRLVLFSVAVNQGSTLVFKTTVGGDRGAKAAAEAGNSCIGIFAVRTGARRRVVWKSAGLVSVTTWRKGRLYAWDDKKRGKEEEWAGWHLGGSCCAGDYWVCLKRRYKYSIRSKG